MGAILSGSGWEILFVHLGPFFFSKSDYSARLAQVESETSVFVLVCVCVEKQLYLEAIHCKWVGGTQIPPV